MRARRVARKGVSEGRGVQYHVRRVELRRAESWVVVARSRLVRVVGQSGIEDSDD